MLIRLLALMLMLSGCATLGEPVWKPLMTEDEMAKVRVSYAPYPQVLRLCEAWSGKPNRPGCAWIVREPEGRLISADIVCPESDTSACLRHELRHIRDAQYHHE